MLCCAVLRYGVLCCAELCFAVGVLPSWLVNLSLRQVGPKSPCAAALCNGALLSCSACSAALRRRLRAPALLRLRLRRRHPGVCCCAVLCCAVLCECRPPANGGRSQQQLYASTRLHCRPTVLHSIARPAAQPQPSSAFALAAATQVRAAVHRCTVLCCASAAHLPMGAGNSSTRFSQPTSVSVQRSARLTP